MFVTGSGDRYRIYVVPISVAPRYIEDHRSHSTAVRYSVIGHSDTRHGSSGSGEVESGEWSTTY
jgi:hypothetical protein